MLIRNYVLNLLVFKNFGSNLYYGNHHMDFLYRPQFFFFFFFGANHNLLPVFHKGGYICVIISKLKKRKTMIVVQIPELKG